MGHGAPANNPSWPTVRRPGIPPPVFEGFTEVFLFHQGATPPRAPPLTRHEREEGRTPLGKDSVFSLLSSIPGKPPRDKPFPAGVLLSTSPTCCVAANTTDSVTQEPLDGWHRLALARYPSQRSRKTHDWRSELRHINLVAKLISETTLRLTFLDISPLGSRAPSGAAGTRKPVRRIPISRYPLYEPGAPKSVARGARQITRGQVDP